VTITTLVPQALAERCYLSEALLWTAFKRLPLSEWTEDGTDTRQALEYIDWPEARDRDLGCMSDEECAGAGLPPDPAYEQMMSGRVRLAPHHIRELMKGISNQERWAEALKESIEFHQRRDVW
jgi:hypothetical protein